MHQNKLLDCWIGKQRFVDRITEMVAYVSHLLPNIAKILKMCNIKFSTNQD